MKKVVIISDTHGMLRAEVKKECQTADWILHAGDVTTDEILNELKEYAPLTAVRGNNDKALKQLPDTTIVKIEGVRFFLVHQIADIPEVLPDVDVIVYGHSHKFAQEIKDEILYLNPGSCGKRRFKLPITMVVMMVDGSEYSYQMMELT